jgi:predicted metalloprotease with PDZ domain
VALPLRPAAGTDLLSVSVGLDRGSKAELVIDTGAADTAIPPQSAGDVTPLRSWITAHARADGSISVFPEFLVPRIQLGSYAERQVIVGVIPAADTPTLGLELLKRFRITLDPRNRLLVLERGSDYAVRSRLTGSTGIGIVRRGADFEVDDLDEGSVGQKAGVSKGDTVLAVDGKSLDGLPEEQAMDLLRGFEGKPAVLRIRHGKGEPIEITFTRVSSAGGPETALSGLTLWKPAGKPVHVDFVAKGSAASHAGLRAGDEIVSLNGKPTTTISGPDLTTLNLDILHLRVRRAGEQSLLDITLESKGKLKQH